jgi:hypothetical protein
MTWTALDKVNENLIPYSNDFSQWGGTATASANAISDTTTLVNQVKTVFAASLCDDYAEKKPRCFSVYILKDNIPAATRFCAIRHQYGSVSVFLKLDTKTGDIDDITDSSISLIDYDVEDDGDYWRLWLAAESNLSLFAIGIFPSLGSGIITNNPNATATGSITCKNAQFENGSSPSDYQETTGTHITWSEQSDASASYSVQSKLAASYSEQSEATRSYVVQSAAVNSWANA